MTLDWDAHHDCIKHLYLEQDMKLAELRAVMKREHDFNASYVPTAQLPIKLGTLIATIGNTSTRHNSSNGAGERILPRVNGNILENTSPDGRKADKRVRCFSTGSLSRLKKSRRSYPDIIFQSSPRVSSKTLFWFSTDPSYQFQALQLQ